MTERLSRLLSPVGRKAFFEQHWGREYLFIEHRDSSYLDDILPIEALDAFLQSEQLPAAFVNVVSKGAAVPVEEWSHFRQAARGQARVVKPERIWSLYRDGATFVINQAHHSIPQLSLACRELSGELNFPVRANIYVTPPNSQGFAKHTDDHEIMILAISGSKRFSLFPAGGKSMDVEIRAGDLLYLPRGLAHEARSSTHSAVHISLGLHALYGFHLIEQLARVAKLDPEFQMLVPDPVGGPDAVEQFRKDFLRRFDRLIAENAVEMLISSQLRDLSQSQRQGLLGRFTDLLRLNEITAGTTLVANSGIIKRFEEDSSEVHVHFAGRQISIPKFLLPSLRRVLDGNPVKVREIPGLMAEAGKLDFARSLVDSGLVSIVSL